MHVLSQLQNQGDGEESQPVLRLSWECEIG